MKPTKKKDKKPIKLSEDAKMELLLNNKMKEMETDFDVKEHLVIDLGNAFTKIGYSGEDMPILTLPSIYGHYNDNDKKNEIAAFDQKMDVFGYEALEPEYQKDYETEFLTPGDHKLKTSTEYLPYLKEILENRLNLTCSEHDVIINTSPIKNEENIRALGKLFLDDLGFKALALMNSSSLSLYSTGRTSGLLVQCGETRTYTVPIYEGFPLYHAINKIKLGGRDLTNVFKDCVVENNIQISPEDIYNLRAIKEKTCCVPVIKPYDYYMDENNPDIIKEETKLFKLPDDQTIVSIPRKSRLIASELLFDPSLIGSEFRGIIKLITNSIKKTEIMDDKLKETLVENIVLSGGTSMMPGFNDRIRRDLVEYKEEDSEWRLEYEPNVIAENSRYISKWIGMSMISSMSSFDKLFIDKSEYTEIGEEKFAEMAQIF